MTGKFAEVERAAAARELRDLQKELHGAQTGPAIGDTEGWAENARWLDVAEDYDG
ncbi:hypothetical protein [Amycolatopsis sp. cmx-4-68]|uniref:hypothetical protein n=1 Tax=Amycolatopsis sp. cmx-4-68 TaxID=2790938 RepID=UPI0039792F5D